MYGDLQRIYMNFQNYHLRIWPATPRRLNLTYPTYRGRKSKFEEWVFILKLQQRSFYILQGVQQNCIHFWFLNFSASNDENADLVDQIIFIDHVEYLNHVHHIDCMTTKTKRVKRPKLKLWSVLVASLVAS